MAKTCIKFVLLFAVIFAIDQAIKLLFLNGFSWQGEFFSLELTLNRGVAFSMFAFLGENLKIYPDRTDLGTCGVCILS